MSDQDIIGSLSEDDIVALTLYGEARNEPIDGIVAVGCVIRNRARTRYRGQTYRDVCLAPWQFSCWKPEGGIKNHQSVMALAAQILNGKIITDDAFRECWWVTAGLVQERLRGNVGKARHYHAIGAKPKWAKDHLAAFTIGRHLFYEGIA